MAGLVLVLGVNRFMNRARSVVNLIGNGIATIAIARWNNARNLDRMQQGVREQHGELAPAVMAAAHAADAVTTQS